MASPSPSPSPSPSVEFQYFNLTIFSDGSIHRGPLEPPPVPPCPSPSSADQVASKDLIINSTHAISARLFLPPRIDECTPKLPILLYFYGGSFFSGSSTLPPHHNFLCRLARHANALIVSINYRLLPEHPLPAAYEDGFQGLMWVEEQAKLGTSAGESWLASYGDFDKCFLGGDSSGATIVHYVAMQAAGYKPWNADADAEASSKIKHVYVQGMILFHPFFTCGRGSPIPNPIELEVLKYSKIKYNDDPLADPCSPEAPSLADVQLPRALVFVAGLDIFKNCGVVYHQNLVDAGKDATIVVHEGECHGFLVGKPESPNVLPALDMVRDFINL